MSLDSGSWVCWSGCGGGWIDTLLFQMGYGKEQIKEVLGGATRPSKPHHKKKQTPVGVRSDENVLPEELLDLFHRCPLKMLEDGWPEGLLYAFEIGYDMGLGRITFPIRNQYNQLVAVSGRSPYSGIIPKYKIYREEDLYELAPEGYEPKRSQAVYNIQRAYMVEPREVVPICEGFKEIMRLHQAGITGIGILGVQFTRQQIQALNRLYHRTRCRFILMLDNDKAGIEATEKLGRQLLGFTNPGIAMTEEVKDISDVSDLQEIKRLVHKPQTFMQWRLHHGQQTERNLKTRSTSWTPKKPR